MANWAQGSDCSTLGCGCMDGSRRGHRQRLLDPARADTPTALFRVKT
jgi:hypothetical protein